METTRESTPYIPPQITSATVVATPSPLTWSQTYHAGKLFAVLALSQNEENEEQTLSSVGKRMLETLEEEYFTLEEKKLDAVKKAIELTLEKVPKGITVCLVALSISGETAHLFLQGDGAILLRRGEKIGNLLHNATSLVSSTGVLVDGDILALTTGQFTKNISPTELFASEFKTPADIVEAVTPKIHGKEDGAASATILQFHNPTKKEEVEVKTPDTQVRDEKEEELEQEEEKNVPIRKEGESRIPKFSRLQLPGKHHMFLGVFLIIIAILIVSVVFVIKQRDASRMHELFTTTFTSAKKQYDEGQALIDLNVAIARTDLEKAKKTLDNTKTQFPKGSDEEKAIDKLLDEIKQALSQTGGKQGVTPKAADMTQSKVLEAVSKDKNAITAAQNDDSVFTASSDTITAIDKKTDKATAIIKNSKDWKTLRSLGSFGSNLYVLDSGNATIIKFVPSGTEYTTNNYLADETLPALHNAVAMTIDSSIYVLLFDGIIKKFTKGKEETFSLTGLTTTFKNATRIITSADMDNIYVLDNGNSRIVILNKKGAYSAELSAGILKDATAMDVVEKDKKIYVLEKNKLWQIPMP